MRYLLSVALAAGLLLGSVLPALADGHITLESPGVPQGWTVNKAAAPDTEKPVRLGSPGQASPIPEGWTVQAPDVTQPERREATLSEAARGVLFDYFGN